MLSTKEIFSKRLKEARLNTGYTQAELAEKLNITQGAYQKWENGTREPSIQNILKLATVLDTTIDYLLGKDKGKGIDFMITSNILPQRLKKLRLEKGMTQTELGKKVGVKQSTFTNWENGKREPSLGKLVLLSKVLATTTDYLLGIDREKKCLIIKIVLQDC